MDSAAGGAGSGTPANAAWEAEGRELAESQSIWSSSHEQDCQYDTSPIYTAPSPITRRRSDSLDSFEDLSLATCPSAPPTSDNDEFEHISHPPHPQNSIFTTRHIRPRRVSFIHHRPNRAGSDGTCELLHQVIDESVLIDQTLRSRQLAAADMEASSSNDYHSSNWQQAGHDADQQDLAGPGEYGQLSCSVSKPQKEGEGTQNAYISYLVTTNTDFKSFTQTHSSVRRRFTDFVFLYKTLQKEYPQCAVPPLPDKHNMSYVRGDRFGSDFTAKRTYSLDRFLKRLALHPVLRRAVVLALFLESTDWNATMRNRPQRGTSGGESAGAGSGVVEGWTDTLINAFSKPHKTDKRFADVNGRATKLNEDLGTVSKTVARVAKREADLETDYADLSTQFQKLATLEPSVSDELTKFANSIQQTSEGWRDLREHTDQKYLGSLKDMEAYIWSVKSLLKTREQKQLDFEGLTEYLTKAAGERDTLASHGGAATSTTGFLRQKIEDVRGVDPSQSRRERQRKLEVQIDRLTSEVESSKKMSEAFDEEVVKEVQDFERIKAVEFRDTLGGLADAHLGFFRGEIEVWEGFVREMEGLERVRGEAGESGFRNMG